MLQLRDSFVFIQYVFVPLLLKGMEKYFEFEMIGGSMSRKSIYEYLFCSVRGLLPGLGVQPLNNMDQLSNSSVLSKAFWS